MRVERPLRVATRKSPLALWQAEEVGRRITGLHPGLEVELVGMTTSGDKLLDSPLAKIGGKALFVKELERALLDGRADIAVHSMKDVPVELPGGLHLPVILEREDPRDAVVSVRYGSLTELPRGGVIGSSSLRRQCQICARHPGLEVKVVRGNVNTRLAKLAAGRYDALILAAAGLRRLGMAERITETLPPERSLPAIGQGALGVECRRDDEWVNTLLAPLDHRETHLRVSAERAMNGRLHGGCQVPLAGYAELEGGTMRLRGLVGYPDGSKIVYGEQHGAAQEGEALGVALAEDLLARGADKILRDLELQFGEA